VPHGECNLLLELCAIFIGAKALGLVFERLALPGVLGEILAGVILGPCGAAFAAPRETSQFLAQLGAVFLLFTVGLATRPQELLRIGSRALGVAASGIVASFALGFGGMWLMRRTPQEATFLAAAMVATSAGITARVLADLGVLAARPARIILGAAVFDDILGMLVLAVVVGLASATGVAWAHLSLVFIEAVAFALLMIFVAPRIIERARAWIDRLPTSYPPLVLALALCLGLSLFAEKIGLAAFIGAFFAGLALAESAPDWRLETPVHGMAQLVTPFFFFLMGARLDLSVVSGGVLAAALVYSLLAVLAKLLGCGLPLVREGWGAALQVGVGMVPRGEVGLLVALVGLQMNRLSPSSYAVVIFMTVATTLLAPPALKALFKHSAQRAYGDSGSVRPSDYAAGSEGG
jgi:Kef-type K+ transport system membrane component KefB